MDSFLKNLSQEEKDTIYEWSERVFQRTEKLSGKMDRIFAQVPPLPYNLVVYRGLSDVDWSEVLYDIDHFVATATNASAAKRFAGSDCCYMKIHVPIGAKVLPISYAHGLTAYPKDLEILLPRQGIFKVIGSETIDIESHELLMYPPELAAMIARAIAESGIRSTYRNEKLFVVVEYKPQGRMTRLAAAENMQRLRGIYGI